VAAIAGYARSGVWLTIDFIIAVVLALLTIVLLAAWLTLERRHLLYLVAGIAAAGVCLLLRFNDVPQPVSRTQVCSHAAS